MAKSIWKYSLQNTCLEVPLGSILLDVQMQNDVPTAWFLVDIDEKRMERRYIVCYGTGWHIDRDTIYTNHKYVGTLQVGVFVWHFFEVEKLGE